MAKSKLLSRELHAVTQEEIDAVGNVRGRQGYPETDFGCLLCNKIFQAGDKIRWIYANGGDGPFRGGNFHVCEKCDEDDEACLQRAQDLYEMLNGHRLMLERIAMKYIPKDY